jgi:hypothetical protein
MKQTGRETGSSWGKAGKERVTPSSSTKHREGQVL